MYEVHRSRFGMRVNISKESPWFYQYKSAVKNISPLTGLFSNNNRESREWEIRVSYPGNREQR